MTRGLPPIYGLALNYALVEDRVGYRQYATSQYGITGPNWKEKILTKAPRHGLAVEYSKSSSSFDDYVDSVWGD